MIRIAVTGPESSGKTSLAHQVSEVLGIPVVEEFARKYLEAKPDPSYSYEELEWMIEQQHQAIEKVFSQHINFISDTDYLVLMIWMEEVFKKRNSLAHEKILERSFDLYLLCQTDLPWEPDPLRENPNDRNRLFKLFENRLEELQLPFVVIEGSGELRLKKALNAISKLEPTLFRKSF